MATTRQLKVGSQLQQDIGHIIQQQGMAAYGGAMLSVLGVEMSTDLGYAKVVISVFPSSKIEAVRKKLGAEKYIRAELGKLVRHQLRVVPELNFVIDTSLDYVENIERLLKI
jgi:ribosome-binding factor A